MSSQTPLILIGLMSGTSLDGVDGVCARFQANGSAEILGHAFTPFSSDLRANILSLHHPQHNEIHRAEQAALALTVPYQATVAKLLHTTQLSVKGIAALAVHGQTIRHQPEHGYTLQLIAPAHLAEQTEISVICDFRSRDIAAGGQGAPLVPAFHLDFFKICPERAVLNLGGIANISLLQADGTVIGFDTGPANMLLDAWCQKSRQTPYDANGDWAASGTMQAELLSFLYESEPWFKLAPPKSTGRDLFSMTWLEDRLKGFTNLSDQDIQTTLTELTAYSIAHSVSQYAPSLQELVLCGGGAYNPYLCQRIQALLQFELQRAISTPNCSSFGIQAEQVEALAFAWLGYRFLTKTTGNLPSVTGAKGARILGAYYPA